MGVSAPTVREIDLRAGNHPAGGLAAAPVAHAGLFLRLPGPVNVGMAAPTMNRELGFSNAVFGFGAGLFFFGYFMAEIPSNLILDKVGARRWIARILFTWGIVSGADCFRVERLELLRRPLHPRSGRGRVLPGRCAVPDVVVPLRLSHPHDGDIPVGQRDLADHRAADRRVAAAH